MLGAPVLRFPKSEGIHRGAINEHLPGTPRFDRRCRKRWELPPAPRPAGTRVGSAAFTCAPLVPRGSVPPLAAKQGPGQGRTASAGHGRSAVPTRPPARCHLPGPGSPSGRVGRREAFGPVPALATASATSAEPGARRVRRVGRRGEGQSGGGRGAVISQTKTNSAVPGALTAGRASTAWAAREEARGRAAPPGAVAGPHPHNHSVTPRAPCGGRGTFVTQRTARGRRGTADSAPRVPPRSPDGRRRSFPQSRPRDERRAPAPAPHGGAPRGGAPALRAGRGGAESGADQSARGAPPAARA